MTDIQVLQNQIESLWKQSIDLYRTGLDKLQKENKRLRVIIAVLQNEREGGERVE